MLDGMSSAVCFKMGICFTILFILLHAYTYTQHTLVTFAILLVPHGERRGREGRKEGRTFKNGGVATQEKGVCVRVTFLITLLLSLVSDEVHRPRLCFP